LNSNSLTRIGAGLFSGLSALQILTLYSNQITAIADGAFEGLTSLLTL
jgi:hypothetical protein